MLCVRALHADIKAGWKPVEHWERWKKLQEQMQELGSDSEHREHLDWAPDRLSGLSGMWLRCIQTAGQLSSPLRCM